MVQIVTGWWYTYRSEKWWMKVSWDDFFHSQLNGKSLKKCSKPPDILIIVGYHPFLGEPRDSGNVALPALASRRSTACAWEWTRGGLLNWDVEMFAAKNGGWSTVEPDKMVVLRHLYSWLMWFNQAKWGFNLTIWIVVPSTMAFNQQKTGIIRIDSENRTKK